MLCPDTERKVLEEWKEEREGRVTDRRKLKQEAKDTKKLIEELS